MARVNFTKEQDCFLRDNIHKCYTLYDLTELFNNQFPEHLIKYSNLQKRLAKLGLKKETHNIRKDKIPSKNCAKYILTKFTECGGVRSPPLYHTLFLLSSKNFKKNAQKYPGFNPKPRHFSQLLLISLLNEVNLKILFANFHKN